MLDESIQSSPGQPGSADVPWEVDPDAQQIDLDRVSVLV